MKIYVGDSKLVKIDKRRCERLDDGDTCTNEVYRKGKDVYKFFHSYLDEEKNLIINKNQYFLESKLNLKVISMLDELIYNSSRKCIGTHALYVDGIKKMEQIISCLLEMNKNQFLESFYLLEEDLEVLTKKNIAVYDLLPHNSVLKNGILHHVDYGDFNICSNSSKNEKLMNEYISELFEYFYDYLGYDKESFYLIPREKFVFLKSDMNESDTVKEFVKRMV